MTAPAPGVTLQAPRPIASLRDIAAHPGLQPLLLQQARRGVVTQLAVRVVLAALVVITVLVLPSATQRVPSTALAFGYLAWSVALAGLAGPGARDVRAVSRAWPALLADLVAVTALTVVAGLEAVSWTATVLTYAFFVVPVLAATQLRPWLCAGVCVPTVAAYFAAGVVAREVNGDEPWASIVLRTAVLALVCAGAVASCRIQLARVIGLARLAADRIELAEQLLTIEERERRDLSEQLHDGALQYVLAARMDLEDLDGVIATDTHDRLDRALTTTAQLLRSTVSELNPAVLAHAGLVPALHDLAAEHGRRGGFTVAIEAEGWPAAATTADAVLFATARELLANAVKHAAASAVTITLGFDGSRAIMTVRDDGRGVPDGEADRKLAQGHIGLHSRRARVEAAGGSLRLTRPAAGGTRVETVLPAAVDGNGDNQYTFAVGGPQQNILTLENSAKTVHDLAGGQGEAQYQAFNTLCATGSLATCKFDAKSAVSGLGDERLVGTLLDAEGMPIDETMSWSHTTEMTSEWDVEAGLSVGVEGIVTAEVKTKYGQDYSTSDKASSEYRITVDKGNVGWLTYSPPVEKVTGDFTITLGNDTWNLSDVHFDLPKNSGGVGNGGEMHAYQLPKGDPGIPSGTEFVHTR